ncbi:hypothetical protein DOJK_01336 [Patescibacteria group bacterium]|nr:hypothetical protein DOJK_01336 [Patescibacteria group bacterium]
MKAILIHGMGRTPASMLMMAMRLKAAGIKSHCFAYTVTLDTWQSCTQRLETFINQHTQQDDYIIIGHSLGTVLTRAIFNQLKRKPIACFFLAPPTTACLAAKKLSSWRLYKLLMGDMGQLLANESFMNALPIPDVPTKIYAGVAGAQGKYSPFGSTPNDGVLMLDETQLNNIPLQIVPAVHTFIMNHKAVAEDIVSITKAYQQ